MQQKTDIFKLKLAAASDMTEGWDPSVIAYYREHEVLPIHGRRCGTGGCHIQENVRDI